MCTVSVIQHKDQVIITSNRDEKSTRPMAVNPKVYVLEKKKVIFPKDSLSGGSWFTVDEHANIAVLLNGAEEKHISKGNYRKSRGLILMEIIGNDSPIKYWKTINLTNIEPFTIVLLENSELFELCWNGIDKKHSRLKNNEHYIWSSATLYSKAVREKREQWFAEFISKTSEVSAKKILDFHKNTQADDQENGLQINRKNLTKTLSITQSIIQKNKIEVNYIDLNSKQSFHQTCFII
ncbi:NRDE family protein [Maribacter litoralis]|uniref:NRDE family protein n=1 Tax=Maribacter litoralis TaxID=2059726 RepID=UPI003F5CECEF